jgi:NAD-dependent SIR2 family protein deacetylase
LEDKPQTVYILGAGFSCNAALPSQSEITGRLLCHQSLGGPREINELITRLIGQFLEEVFHIWDADEGCPALEDIYTCIDLSIHGGHFLGPSYTPKKLQAIRRFITHRIFQILEQHYQPSVEITELLKHGINNGKCAFITLNWDTVLEKHLADLGLSADYRYDVRPLGTEAYSCKSIPVYKLHGSSNWAYCDNCKYLFHDHGMRFHEHIFLFPYDFALFGHAVDPMVFQAVSCPNCHIDHLSTHIVTFSYRKNFRTTYFGRLWHDSELLLQNAEHWVFIGYSLPKADYQFKHLLKSAELQLGRESLPKISLVTKSDTRSLSPVIARYAAFFGSNLLPQNIYHAGIKEYLIKNR